MSLDFPYPANPGDTYIAPNGVTYTYDGTKWEGENTPIQGATGVTGATGAEGASGAEGATGSFNGNLDQNLDGNNYDISNVGNISLNGDLNTNDIIVAGNVVTLFV
jgi:hypothetical protein